ncbi:hypothetical protein GCM10011575_31460 [Microlunatus endophyticus]|uniref:Uncharacterized protein n=1 Tax=Microlunatus endophyticus TaxID=1716077 RepID=A0A917SDE8_9ACTN|nr:hypothetical protein [Microlunatus endophyticus]GGL70673.1 hypothetical protein GCM10011575_31460 [Microlunatus endophyticus]
MTALAMLWTDIRILLVDTTRIWWRLLPKILTIYVLGWLGYEVCFKLAEIAGDLTAWLSLVIFAIAFVSRLAALVLILRMVGNALGVRHLIPKEEQEDDDRDAGVTRLLALTLLPFLGIYTAFGLIQDASSQLVIESDFRSGGIWGNQGILGQIRLNGADVPARRYVLVLAIIVGTYILRRGLDLVHERTGFRPLGIVVAFIEAFFVLVTITFGYDLLARIPLWLKDRQFMVWISDVRHAVGNLIALTGINPDVFFAGIGSFISNQVWPVITSGLTQPIFWLAIAALVYGSSVISVAELWRRGRPLASRVRLARRALERAARQEAAGGQQHGGEHHETTGARLVAEIREAFFGDIDDKYLPTLHSLRLVLRAGFTFLGAYVVVYSAQAVGSSIWSWALNQTIGGHPMTFWMVFLPAQDFVTSLPFEPWRLCLLAVALRRCLMIFRLRAESRGTANLEVGAVEAAREVAAADLGSRGTPVPETAGVR